MLRSLIQNIHYRILLFILRFTTPDPVEYLCPLISNPRLFLKIVGVSIGKNVRIGNGLVIHNFNEKNLIIGDDVHIGKNVFLDTSELIEIKNRCTVSMRVTILTHLDVGDSRLSVNFPKSKSSLTLNQDCYLGANVSVINSVEFIGEKTLIGANSLVNTNIESNSLYAGNPAKFIRPIK